MIKMQDNFQLGQVWLERVKRNQARQMKSDDTLNSRRLNALVRYKVREDLRRVVHYIERHRAWYRRTDFDTICAQVIRDTAVLMFVDIDYEKYFNAHLMPRRAALDECYHDVQFDKDTLQDSRDVHSTDQFAHHLGSARMQLFLYQDQKPIRVLEDIPTNYVMRQVTMTSSRAHNLSRASYQAVDGDTLVYYCQRLIIALGQVSA